MIIDKPSTLKKLNEIFLSCDEWEGKDLLNLCQSFMDNIPYRIKTDCKDWLHMDDVTQAFDKWDYEWEEWLQTTDRDYTAARNYVKFWMEIKLQALINMDSSLFISTQLVQKLNQEYVLFGKTATIKQHAGFMVKQSKLSTMLKDKYRPETLDEMLVLRELVLIINRFMKENKENETGEISED